MNSKLPKVIYINETVHEWDSICGADDTEYVRRDLVDELIEWADILLSTSDIISIDDYKLAEKAIESIRGTE